MNYDPSKAKENTVIPKGWYGFEIVNAEETVSKKGFPMIKVTYQIWEGSNKRTVFTYYLLEHPDEETLGINLGQLENLCKAVGLHQEFKDVKLEDYMLKGKSGQAYVIISKGSGGYGPSNSVSRCKAGEETNKVIEPEPELEHSNTPTGDDIPF